MGESENIELIVEPSLSGMRLDAYLREQTPFSRSRIASLMEEGALLVNGEVERKTARKTEGGMRLLLVVPEAQPVDIVPQNIPLDILYQDADVVVVNKKSGMVVHPAAGNESGTLVNALLYHVHDLSGIGGEMRPGIVHRLDKDTSGLILIAKNDAAHASLSEQFKARTMEKHYRAIAHGSFSKDEGMIDAPIGRHPIDRKKMAVVRLEAANPLSKELEKYFCEKFKIGPECIFRTKMPMKLDFIFAIADKLPESMKRTLVDEPFSPQPAAMLHEGSVMEQVKKKDVLLSYPYESMEPFLQMIREAASDPDVLTIKITIYRLAKKARLVEYLCAAAENGKEVTVLIELRARFDEQNNIEWSERLEEAGCRVLYGFEGYKVHSKICLITYRSKSEPNNKNEIRYITQIGTGNYNEKTAKMYTDYSLMTANQEIGTDAAEFFKNMSIGNLHGAYRHLIVSPVSLKARVLATMDEEIEKGSAGRIIMKMNSVTDVDFIRKVEEASCAGVKVDLIVRGICCILPQVPGHTENVRVTSIVGRYLEHPRVFVFGKGEKTKIYIGSADMMTRNTEKRVEVACPVYDEAVKKRLLHQLKVMLADNVKAREMAEDGTYHKKAESGRKINAQETFMQEALHARKEETREMREQKNTGVIKRVLGFFRRRK